MGVSRMVTPGGADVFILPSLLLFDGVGLDLSDLKQRAFQVGHSLKL